MKQNQKKQVFANKNKFFRKAFFLPLILHAVLFAIISSSPSVCAQEPAVQGQESSNSIAEATPSEYISTNAANANATNAAQPSAAGSIVIDVTQQLKISQSRATLLESAIADIQSRSLSAISKLKILTLHIPDGQLKDELIKIINILEGQK